MRALAAKQALCQDKYMEMCPQSRVTKSTNTYSKVTARHPPAEEGAGDVVVTFGAAR